MINLQYEIKICQKNHTEVTMTMSKVYPVFLKQYLVVSAGHLEKRYGIEVKKL